MRINIDLSPQLQKAVEKVLRHHDSELLLLSPHGEMVVKDNTDHVVVWYAIEDAKAGDHDAKIAGITWRFDRRFKREQ